MAEATNTLTADARRALETLTAEDKDALGRWLAGACTRAGITNKAQRLKLQAELLALLEPGRGARA